MLSDEKSKAMKILFKEYEDLMKSPLLNLSYFISSPDANNIFNWRLTIFDPEDSL